MAIFHCSIRVKTYNTKQVELSKIVEQYKKDFTADGKTELEWIKQYRKEKPQLLTQWDFINTIGC
jgi:hypothetical protein